MIYLGQPYTDRDFEIMAARFKIAEFMTAEYMKAGDIVYSPIVHCHKIAVHYKMPTTWEFWEAYDLGILKHCDTMRVLQMPGWERSRGLTAEIKFAEENGITVEPVSWSDIYPRAYALIDDFGDPKLRYWLDKLK
jgi:hypothetical protein